MPANEKRASSLQFSLESSVGKRSFELQFGALRPDQTVEARLIRDGKPAGVFALPLILSQMVSLPNEAYRNLKVLRMEADNVQRAKLSIEGKERFTLERAGSDWKVFSGGRALGDGSEEAGRFLNRMTTLRGIGIAAEGQTSRDCDGMRARAKIGRAHV
mgnify:FL=1